MLYVAGWELRNQLSRTSRFFVTMYFIFIYNPRSGSALYEKELDEIRNWPSVLKTPPLVLMKGNELARYPTANLRACRLSTASFIARFSFSFCFFISLNSIHVRSTLSRALISFPSQIFLDSINNSLNASKFIVSALTLIINVYFQSFNINPILHSIILNDAS